MNMEINWGIDYADPLNTIIKVLISNIMKVINLTNMIIHVWVSGYFNSDAVLYTTRTRLYENLK